MPASPLTPVTLLTGTSGSGKTTLLARARRDPGLNEVAVVGCASPVRLNWNASGQAQDLASSCLCCSTQDELIGILREMYYQRAAGMLPFFRRVVIEASGHTDPQRIAGMLAALPLASARYALDGIVTVVDAVQGAVQGADILDKDAAARRQVQEADCLVISKADCATNAGYQEIEHILAELNPHAPRFNAQDTAFNPAALFTNALRPAQVRAA